MKILKTMKKSKMNSQPLKTISKLFLLLFTTISSAYVQMMIMQILKNLQLYWYTVRGRHHTYGIKPRKT